MLTGIDEEPIWQWGFIERVSTALLCFWRGGLGLTAISGGSFFAELDSARIPTIYGFSPAVLPAPRGLPP